MKQHEIRKKTQDYNIKFTHSENAKKMRCNANHRHCATHWKPETRNLWDSSNPCVCLYRSLKPLTDDQVTSLWFNSNYYIVLCNLRLN